MEKKSASRTTMIRIVTKLRQKGTNMPENDPITSHRKTAILAMLVCGVMALGASCPPQGTVPPPAPKIVAGVTNAKLTPATLSAPAIVSISTIPWQSRNARYPSTFSWGWLEDALVGDPFAFQIRIDINLGNSSFSVLDAAGAKLASVVNRSNTSHTCLPPGGGGGIPGTECYWSPGNSFYVVPPPVPATRAVYSIGLVNTCSNAIEPSRTVYTLSDRAAHCATGQANGAAVLLTISPARPLFFNVKERFTLVASNSAGPASTPFDVVYLPPPVIPAPGLMVSGTTSPAPNMPTPPPPCPNQPSGQEQTFAFQLTCFGGGAAHTIKVSGIGCTQAQARQFLANVYATEITQGCILQ